MACTDCDPQSTNPPPCRKCVEDAQIKARRAIAQQLERDAATADAEAAAKAAKAAKRRKK